MPTFRHGKATRVLIHATDMSEFLNEVTATVEIETAETTTFTADDKTYITGLGDGTMSLSGLFDSTAGAIDPVLRGRIGVEQMPVTVYPSGLALGNPAIVSGGEITSYETTSPVADVVSVSVEVQSSGGLHHGNGLLALLNTAASVNGTSVDQSASTSSGVIANMHVTANTRDASSTIKVQHSQDNITFTDLATFTGVAASTTVGESITAAGNVLRYLRAQVVPGGSSGSITVNVAAARR